MLLSLDPDSHFSPRTVGLSLCPLVFEGSFAIACGRYSWCIAQLFIILKTNRGSLNPLGIVSPCLTRHPGVLKRNAHSLHKWKPRNSPRRVFRLQLSALQPSPLCRPVLNLPSTVALFTSRRTRTHRRSAVLPLRPTCVTRGLPASAADLTAG